MDSKPDCKLGVGYNANLLISEIFAKNPLYLEIAQGNKDISDETRKVIQYYIEKDKEKKQMAKTKEASADAVELKTKCILGKINAIRQAWGATEVEKEGKGKAGGGSKYDYYKPQQIIEFCLTQELEQNLFSEFKIDNGICSYILTDIDTGDTKSVECPFEIPRKMAASEAQQVGAAMTYHNRRLAMMMYKIEDNSKENADVLENADFSAQNMPAPFIPAPPIITPPPANFAPPPPVSAEVVAQNIASENVKVESLDELENKPTPPTNPTSEPIIIEEETPIVVEEESKIDKVAPPVIEKVASAPPPPPPITPYIAPRDMMDGTVGVTPPSPSPSIPPPPPVKVDAPASEVIKGRIESMYE